jgi:hypothetical protein
MVIFLSTLNALKIFQNVCKQNYMELLLVLQRFHEYLSICFECLDSQINYNVV